MLVDFCKTKVVDLQTFFFFEEKPPQQSFIDYEIKLHRPRDSSTGNQRNIHPITIILQSKTLLSYLMHWRMQV
jgi:hypothetical protein